MFAPAMPVEQLADGDIEGTSFNLYVGVHKDDIMDGCGQFKSDDSSAEFDCQRVPFTIHRGSREFIAQPVAWLLMNNYDRIVAANAADPNHISTHNRDSIVVKKTTFNRYRAEVERLVELANRKISNIICIEAIPDPDPTPAPWITRVHAMNLASAAATADAKHHLLMDIEITVFQFAIHKTLFPQQAL
jgi:hypothetical protein